MTSIDIEKLIKGDRRALAKAITLVESQLDTHQSQAQQLIEKILPHTGQSKRIGISGVPGVGKSTFIEAFGLHLIKEKKTNVAVLAVDPSSPVSGGSILGDKTRMEKLSQEYNAFIRPSPNLGFLGGVAQKTRESLLLCEAAGYKNILIETVGVGQSEYEVSHLVDFFLILMLPNAGDELQGIKKGILELVHALIINKADGTNINGARQAKNQYESALNLLAHNSKWKTPVEVCSALENKNIDTIWSLIEQFYQCYSQKEIQVQRAQQNKLWLDKLITEFFYKKLHDNPRSEKKWQEVQVNVLNSTMTPLAAAKEVIKTMFQ